MSVIALHLPTRVSFPTVLLFAFYSTPQCCALYLLWHFCPSVCHTPVLCENKWT